MSPPRLPDGSERQPPRRPRLAFYRRLTGAQKREYDRSDAVTTIPLRPDVALGAATNRLVAALEDGRTPAVRVAAQELAERICGAVLRRRAGRPPRIRVLRARPRLSGGEFHGLYTQTAGGESEIRVWMLTATHRQVVKPRTFLRTLLHELVHHFDMTLLELPSSFHTPGFHARESSLLRALERSGARIPGGRAQKHATRVPKPPRDVSTSAAATERSAADTAPGPQAPLPAPRRGRRRTVEQLDLFPKPD